MSELTRIPPQNLDAENYVLGSLLIDSQAIIKIADILYPDDFYKEAHGLIYGAIQELYSRHEPIDVLSLTSKLEEQGKLEVIGGRSYIANLASSVGTSANIEYHAESVQKKSTLRKLISSASAISSMGYNEDEDIDAILSEAEQKLFAVSQKFVKQSFFSIESLLASAFERIEDLHQQAGKLRGLSTGFTEMDKILGGLQKSDLIILAARPSVGKTSFVLDIARQAAVINKMPVALFSLEMSKEQLVDRLLSSESGVDLRSMRLGMLSENSDDFSRIADAMGKLAEAPVFIDDTAGANIMQIRTKARRLQMEKGLGLIIIDYLQLMDGGAHYKDNRVQQISEITRALKIIARELDVPIIALSQLSRAVEQTKPAIPKLSHLRESGSIEQDADIVMFIYRKSADRNYDLESLTEEEKSTAEIHIAKHRNGPVGIVHLRFHAQTVSFKNDASMMRGLDNIPDF